MLLSLIGWNDPRQLRMSSVVPCLVFLCSQGIQRSKIRPTGFFLASTVDWRFSVTNIFQGVEVTPYCSSGGPVDPWLLLPGFLVIFLVPLPFESARSVGSVTCLSETACTVRAV